MINLTKAEKCVFTALKQSPGVLSAKKLGQIAMGIEESVDSFNEISYGRNVISRLRVKLGKDFVITVHERGYQLR